jgi:hypothetical protein
MPLIAPERLGEFDRFIDHHTIGHLGVGRELIGGQKQDGMLYGGNLGQRPIELRRKLRT